MRIDHTSKNYRVIIKQLVSERKRLDPNVNFSTMAKAMRVERTYVSKVLNSSDANFSRDQLYNACRFLQLDDADCDFCLLLLDRDTTNDRERKRRLTNQIDDAIARIHQTEKHISAKLEDDSISDEKATYYLDPIMTLVHLALTIEYFQLAPEKLCQALDLSQAQLAATIVHLQDLGIIKLGAGNKLCPTMETHHIGAKNALTTAHQAMIKNLGMARMLRLPPTEKYSFMLTFSATDSTMDIIKRRLLDMLKELEPVVRAAEPKRLFQLNLELFPWHDAL